MDLEVKKEIEELKKENKELKERLEKLEETIENIKEELYIEDEEDEEWDCSGDCSSCKNKEEN